MSRAQIFSALGEEVSENQRERLGAAFDAVVRAVDSGELDPTALPTLQAELGEALRASRQGPLSAEAVDELTASLEAVAASAPSGDVAPPP